MNKKQIIYSLVVFAFALIIINIFVESNQGDVVKSKYTVATIKDIENNFLKSLRENGISGDWIQTKKIRNSKNDSLVQTFNVEVPSDLPIVTLISDVSRVFQRLGLEIKTEEKKNFSNSVLKVYADKELKLLANLNQSKDNIREYTKILFLIVDADFADKELPEKLKTFKIPVNFLFTPSETLYDSAKYVSSLRLSYALLLNDDIEGAKYELDPDANKNVLARNIKNIVSSFGSNRVFIIDEKSNLYKSVAFNFVQDEFKKRGVQLVKRSEYIDLADDPLDQIASLFEYHCDNGKSKDTRIIIINYNDFINLQPVITKQKKLGNKFFHL